MPSYSTTLDIEVSVSIAEDVVLECKVPIKCEFWTNGADDPTEHDEETSILVDRDFVEPEWFHVSFRDIALKQADALFFAKLDKYEN